MEKNADALSVSELNEYARKLLAGDPLLRNLRVSGEISGYKHHYSGHRYFSLKDDSARVQCVMFRQHATGLDFTPADGMQVVVRGAASVFPRDGAFQLYVNQMQKAGQGDLFAQFERLKKKLLAEGLFDPARKREIPLMPRTIGVVTSETGAAIRDIIHVARRRNPNVGIIVSPCLVQGSGAADDIVRALNRLNRNGECDVILVGRGGGSMEDLWCFNEESVARAIAASRIPVISCVGHEVDFTIADFVADLRAPTPSAAAELAVPVLEQLNASLNDMLARVGKALTNGQQLRRLRLEQLAERPIFQNPGRSLLEPRRMALDQLSARAAASTLAVNDRAAHRMNAIEASLRSLDPAAVLKRGYAIVRREGRIVGSVVGISAGDALNIGLSDGCIVANAVAVKPGDGNHGTEDQL